MQKEDLKKMVYPVIGACQEVHKDMGPFLNEYMYQDAMAIELELRGIPFEKEFQFEASYKGHKIEHKHIVDFNVKYGSDEVLLECKAVDHLVDEHRQQLWNYMRLSGVNVGVLYNFAPIMAQCEKYCYDASTGKMLAF